MPLVPDPESLEDDQQVLLRRSRPGAGDARLGGARAALRDTLGAGARAVGASGDRAGAGGRGSYLAQDARGALPDDPVLHRALLAFVSDMSLLDTALLPHGKSIFSDVQVASLDHAMWFHRPVPRR